MNLGKEIVGVLRDELEKHSSPDTYLSSVLLNWTTHKGCYTQLWEGGEQQLILDTICTDLDYDCTHFDGTLTIETRKPGSMGVRKVILPLEYTEDVSTRQSAMPTCTCGNCTCKKEEGNQRVQNPGTETSSVPSGINPFSDCPLVSLLCSGDWDEKMVICDVLSTAVDLLESHTVDELKDFDMLRNNLLNLYQQGIYSDGYWARKAYGQWLAYWLLDSILSESTMNQFSTFISK